MSSPARKPVPEASGPAVKTERSRGEQIRETLVFLFLIVPSMGLSFFVARQGNLSFVLVAVATILRDLSFVALIGFFLWRNGERWSRIGWKIKNGWNEVLLGAALFVPVFFGAGLLERVFETMGLSAAPTRQPQFLTATNAKEIALGAVLVTVVAVCEEIIFRGYLIDRLATVTRSTAAAVLLSSLIFSLGHGYEGMAGVATVGVLGATFAVVYLWRRNLTAPIVMHFLQDFIGIVMVPLLRHR